MNFISYLVEKKIVNSKDALDAMIEGFKKQKLLIEKVRDDSRISDDEIIKIFTEANYSDETFEKHLIEMGVYTQDSLSEKFSCKEEDFSIGIHFVNNNILSSSEYIDALGQFSPEKEIAKPLVENEDTGDEFISQAALESLAELGLSDNEEVQELLDHKVDAPVIEVKITDAALKFNQEIKNSDMQEDSFQDAVCNFTEFCYLNNFENVAEEIEVIASGQEVLNKRIGQVLKVIKKALTDAQ